MSERPFLPADAGPHRGRAPSVAWIALLALVGGALVYAGTPWGMGLSPDSTAYIAGARNLLDGRGFVRISARDEPQPITLYPPLYSVVLAAPGLIGLDPLDATRPIGVLLLALNAFLLGLTIRRATSGHAGATLLGEALFLASPDTLTLHTMAWSEPLFLSFVLATFLALAAVAEGPRRRHLVALSLLVALSMLARYAGVALLATVVASVLLFSPRPPALRARAALLHALVASVPVALWALRNVRLTGNAVSREIAGHSIQWENIVLGLRTLARWVLIDGAAAPIAGTVVLLACTILGLSEVARAASARRTGTEVVGEGNGARVLRAGAAVFFGVYTVFVLASHTLVEADLPLDLRILAPLHPAAILVVLASLANRPRAVGDAARRRAQVARAAAWIAFAGLLVVSATESARWVREARRDGRGYAGKAWRESAIIAATRALPSDARVYTNAPDAVNILTGRPATRVPRKVDQHAMQPNPRYQAELEEIDVDLREHRGVIVLLNRVSWRWYLPSEEELVAALRLAPVARVSDGVIYAAEGTALGLTDGLQGRPAP